MCLCVLTRVLTSTRLFLPLIQSPAPFVIFTRFPESVFFHFSCPPSNFQCLLSSIFVLSLRYLVSCFSVLIPSPALAFLLLPGAFSQCDQDQCIQSTKFVLQAAATPLLQQQSSEPVIMTASPENGAPLPGRASLTLGGPCTSLPLGQPTPPTSTPSLSCHEPTDMLPIHGHSHTHNHSHPLQEQVAHHHFLTPEEVPSPPGMLHCGSPLGHSHTVQAGFYNPASQDSLHEDSVRGLVKLSSV